MVGWSLPFAPEQVFSLALAQERVGVMQFATPGEAMTMNFIAVVLGAKGERGGSYTHTQTSLASSWTVNHNLGYRPAVQTLTAGGQEFWGEVLHVSVNQAVLYFDSPNSGLAICS